MPDFSFCLYAEDPSCHTSEFLTSSNCLLVLDSSLHLKGTWKIIHLYSLWTNCSSNSLTSYPRTATHSGPRTFPLSFTCHGHLVYCCYDLDLRLSKLYRCSLSSQFWGIVLVGYVQPLVRTFLQGHDMCIGRASHGQREQSATFSLSFSSYEAVYTFMGNSLSWPHLILITVKGAVSKCL